MWNPFTAKTTTYTEQLEALVEQQRQIIHQQQSTIALLLGQSPPAPLPLRSRRLSQPSGPQPSPPHRVRGAEDVSVLDRAQRRERDLKAEVEVALPEYMRNPRQPTGPVPEGKNLGGGFSPLSDQPPSPAPDAPSTTSSSSKPLS